MENKQNLIKVNGNMTKWKEMVYINLLMEMFMKENSSRDK